MKNVGFPLVLILFSFTIISTNCKKNEEPLPPTYTDRIYPDTVSSGSPIYWGECNISTNFGVNYTGGLGGALRAGRLINGESMCDSNTFVFSLRIIDEPNKILNVFPQIFRGISIHDIPFKTGKFNLIDKAYGDKKNCLVDTFPRTDFFIALNDKDDLQIIGEYKVGKSLSNFIEITKMDTANNNIRGNFQATLLNVNPKNNKQAPDTVSINCSSFTIPWGKKRKG